MTQREDPLSFLREFFGDGNSIKWDQYESGAPTDSVRASLEPWVLRFQKRESPYLLPRVDPSSSQTSWYVLCSDSREARSMRESLLAFIGPTYSRFSGEFASLDPSDSIEALCKSHFGSLVFRLPVCNSSDRTRVGKLLSTLVDYRERESGRSLAAVKPIGRLLRDLEMAILANNEQSAWAAYTEIRSRGRLSATNLAFLQVRIYGAFERWSELLLLPNLSELLQVRRPKRVSDQIAQAVYQHHFAKHEEDGDATGALATYQSSGHRYQKLVRSTEGLQSPDTLKFALVSAVASDPPRRNIAEQISDHAAMADDAAWASALLATLPAPQSAEVVFEAVTGYDVADARYNENNFDDALALYLEQPHTARSICRVLETAVEVDTPQSAEDALEYLATAPDDIRGHVLGRRACTNHIEFLSRVLGQDSAGDPKRINSLSEWFEFVDSGENLETASEVLQYGIKTWRSSSSFDPDSVAQHLQNSRTGKQAEIVRNAVPTFIRALLVDTPASRECKPIYSALTELLIYDESVGPDDLAAVDQLTEAILTTAPSHADGSNDFAFAAEITVHLWEAKAAPRHFDWVLSMLDLLIDTGGQQHANLTPILAAIAESSHAWSRRVSDDQWSLLELLASDLNLTELTSSLRPEPEESTEDEKPDIRGILAGKSIAVYSLTERIARRFGQLAEQAFDGIKIHYIHDKSLTDRMKSLAQSADIFIVNTWDAKHAATNGIKDNRPDNAVILETDGKSASALLRRLLVHLAE